MKFSVVCAAVALTFTHALCAQDAAAPAPEAAAAPAKPADDTAALIDKLSPTELEEVLTLLRDHFIKPEMLADLALKRATVLGAIQRLAPGAALLAAPKAAESDRSPFRSEILDGRIGYARLGSVNAANLVEFDAALEKFKSAKVAALVLDLRATTGTSEFEQMAEVCRRFVPKGKVLFSVRKAGVQQEQVLTSKEDPTYAGVLLVLTDRANAGAPEVIAAVLRSHVNAMIIGQQTRGEAVEFATFPLTSGAVVRIAVAEVALPDKVTIFPGGVKPDVAVDVPAETTAAVLKQGLEKGMSELVFETERVRMNEAALVAGTNPELELAIAAQKNKGEKAKAPLRDAVLQRAVDFVTTLAIYQKNAKPAK